MKTLILDLQEIDIDGGETWGDSNARAEIENAILDYAGKIIKVQITISGRYRQSRRLVKEKFSPLP